MDPFQPAKPLGEWIRGQVAVKQVGGNYTWL